MLNETTLTKLSFLIALVATVGSLYFSEVLGYPPCVLCWYQRVCMYPLVIIFFSALWTNDRNYSKYVIPLIFIGSGIAVYHNLLYYGFIADSIVPCTQGISCTSKQIEWFGFITIPLLSLSAFLALSTFEVLKFVKLRKLL